MKGPAAERVPLILLAEDDDDFRDFVSCLLQRDGYELLPVCDGGAAMNYIDVALRDPLSTPLPDVLITDIFMPCCNGFEVLAYTAFLPTIAMTAFGDSLTHERALKRGADFVFDKPLDVSKLRKAVRTLARRSLVPS